MITKSFFSAAIVLGALAGAAPAGADPTPCANHPNPFGALTSRAHEAPRPGASGSQELDRGLHEALGR
jgi:hypothetical protein